MSMSNDSDLETEVLYYERFKQRVLELVELDDEASEAVFVVHDDRTDDVEEVRYDLMTAFEAAEDGDLERIGEAEYADVEPAEDVDDAGIPDRYTEEPEDVDVRTRLQRVGKRLADLDHVDATIEDDLEVSPALRVIADDQYGAPAHVMAILVDEFEPSEFLEVTPIDADGVLGIMYVVGGSGGVDR